MLYFYVKGSAKEPYKITADGVGAALKLFCTCPAGKRGGGFCKHQQALLLGDVTHLVQPSDSVVDLARCAQGSKYVSKALSHVPAAEKKPVIPGYETLEQVRGAFGAALEAKGFVVALEDVTASWPAKELQCYGLGKHKKMLKYPVLALRYDEQTADLIAMEDGTTEYRNFRPRMRPWTVYSRNQVGSGTWSELGRALPQFLNAAGILWSAGEGGEVDGSAGQ